MSLSKGKFRYVYSCDFDSFVQIKIGTLEGERAKLLFTDLLEAPLLSYSGICKEQKSEIFVTCEIYCNEESVFNPIQTSYKWFGNRWSWNEWITLPIRFCDLSRDAILALTIWDLYATGYEIPIGSTTIPLFGKHGTFRQGMHDLKVWPYTKVSRESLRSLSGKLQKEESEMARLLKLAKKHRNGQIASVDWLDRLTFREIELINEKEKRETEAMFLMIEFPRVVFDNHEYTVVYYELNGDSTLAVPTHAEIVEVPDPEIGIENLVESKHHRLARSLRTGPLDRELKPNAPTRDLLNEIIKYPPTKLLSAEEQDMIWKFRFYLSSQKEALTKFLKSVNWQLKQEADQAFELLKEWSPMDIEDALELLSPTFTNGLVRKYAVFRLREASDEDLLLYLLQLVQALKYENYHHNPPPAPLFSTAAVPSSASSHPDHLPLSPPHVGLGGGAGGRGVGTALSPSSAAHDLSVRHPLSTTPDLPTTSGVSAVPSPGANISLPPDEATDVANDPTELERSFDQHEQSLSGIKPPIATKPENLRSTRVSSLVSQKSLSTVEVLRQEMDLATFLITRACTDMKLANYFYWYLVAEVGETWITDPSSQNVKSKPAAYQQRVKNQRMYQDILKRFVSALGKCASEKRSQIVAMRDLVESIRKVAKLVQEVKGNYNLKVKKLKEFLAEPSSAIHSHSSPSSSSSNFSISHFDPIPFILDPDVTIKAVQPQHTSLLKSSLMPVKLVFVCDNDEEYVTIFKHGDDLRQDQLVLQMISLMDKLLRRENLDLKLTPYKVLAVSPKHGFVQFVESKALADVKPSILEYLRSLAPSDSSPYGLQPEVLDNYIRSCAGYTVVTYILGVGDRHLDNLLITNDGRLFHVDFGYIFGRDPKPMAPVIKLTKEMIEVMGGQDSEHFLEFNKLCYTAFLILRRYASLFLNLLSLVVDADIPDIAIEPDKVVRKLQEKFMLRILDEEAVRCMKELIDASISSKTGQIIDWTHRWAMIAK